MTGVFVAFMAAFSWYVGQPTVNHRGDLPGLWGLLWLAILLFFIFMAGGNLLVLGGSGGFSFGIAAGVLTALLMGGGFLMPSGGDHESLAIANMANLSACFLLLLAVAAGIRATACDEVQEVYRLRNRLTANGMPIRRELALETPDGDRELDPDPTHPQVDEARPNKKGP